jgi:Second Messenger Oligonucleotide or Dinucleotide Synthetase domain
MLGTIQDRATAIDSLLFEVCETLQLSPSQHSKAVSRYLAISDVLNSPASPFSFIESNVYSQGSMRLGTTVKPINGPHDLDFVCELAISHVHADPIDLLNKLFGFFKDHGVYSGMVTRKNRCIRITYTDEFYLDLLPACRDHKIGGHCVQVPDRDSDGWKPSNPLGYAKWFEQSTKQVIVTKFAESYRAIALDKALSIEPIPDLEATCDKKVLQLVVQLMKRWRDIHYVDSSFPPISIVLTTLAADCYRGEEMLSEALLAVLERIVARLDAARAVNRRIQVLNPVHNDEDFSERWDNNLKAYQDFESGIRRFAAAWRFISMGSGNVNGQLEDLFGGVINTVVLKRARRLQESRENGRLGILGSGIITSAATSVAPMRPNTNDGE